MKNKRLSELLSLKNKTIKRNQVTKKEKFKPHDLSILRRLQNQISTDCFLQKFV
jgi:hypothetical protein